MGIEFWLTTGIAPIALLVGAGVLRRRRRRADRLARAAESEQRARRERAEAAASAAGKVISEAGAVHLVLGRDLPVKTIPWEEPNRAFTPTLHIGDHGERTSTLTGAWWLDATRVVVNHRSGLAVAVFDAPGATRIGTAALPHLTDDIAARPLGEGRYEIAVSGCWDAMVSRLSLDFDPNGAPRVELLETRSHVGRDFAHGVAYDAHGTLCYSIHTGADPRICIGEQVSRLPRPWGARDLCHDPARRRYIAVAVSANPGRAAYSAPLTSLWTMPDTGGGTWTMLTAFEGIHSDCVDVHGDEIWIPDQHADRMLALSADGSCVLYILSGPSLDFPHGTAIGPSGCLAVTNYRSSSVTLIDLADVRAAALALGSSQHVETDPGVET